MQDNRSVIVARIAIMLIMVIKKSVSKINNQNKPLNGSRKQRSRSVTQPLAF